MPLAQLIQHARERYRTLTHWMGRHPYVMGWSILAATAIGLTLWSKIFERMVPTVNDGWAIYWPYNGIIIAFLLMSRRRWWAWILGGFVCAFVRIELLAHDSPGELTVDILNNLIEIVIAAYALPRFRSLKQWMTEPRLASRFVLYAILLGPLLTCWPVAWYFGSRFPGQFWDNVILWGFSDALGVALWLPLTLILFSRETYDLFRWRALPETLALLASLCCVSVLTFHQDRYPLEFLPYPMLLFVALRLGFSGAVISVNLLTLVTASLSLHGFGPFHSSTRVWDHEHTVVVQVFSTLAMLFVLPLSVKLIERRKFEDQLQQAYGEMKRLATVDKLTGVSNRRHFDQILDMEWSRAQRNGSVVGLLMVDADCFKAYNDLYGHLAGDECLRQIAEMLSAEPLRQNDSIARYGGEEFAILLPGATGAPLHDVAERLRVRVAAARIPHEGNAGGFVTISAGCASLVPGRDMLPESLVAAADAALYAAKEAGRNRVLSATAPQRYFDTSRDYSAG